MSVLHTRPTRGYSVYMRSSRQNPPRYAPDAQITRLRKAGWTYEAIARSLKASLREVYRWAAGDSRPIGIYADMLASLPTQPARVSRLFRPRELEQERGDLHEVLVGEGTRGSEVSGVGSDGEGSE